MKKIRLQLLLALLLPFVGQLMLAGEVSEQEALMKAQQFLQGRTFGQKTLRRAAANNTIAQDAFYVFNADGDKGFVIVSADDRTTAILGYAEEGHLDLNNLPENAASWLKDYARQIKSLGDAASLAPQRAPGTEVVAPLMTTKWDQDEPYNRYCPTDASGKCVTGCTATAMAQIMFYNKWPQSAGPFPAYKSEDISSFDMPQLEASAIEYNKMRDTYVIQNKVAQYTDEEAEAVARLMYYCGHAVKMQYSSNISLSSCYSRDMVESFGYSKTAIDIMRYGFTNDEWEKIIYSEMLARRVVLYRGENESGGHAFIIDGYDGKGLFHVNWGWGGKADGFFLLTLLNTDSQGIDGRPFGNGLSQMQRAIIGLKRPEAGDVEAGSVIYANVSTTQNAPKVYTRNSDEEDFKDVKCSSRFSYSGVSAPVIEILINTFQDGNYKEMLTEPYEVAFKKDQPIWLNHIVSFGKGYADGTYEIVPCFRIKGTDKWMFPRADFTGFRTFATIKGNQLTLSESPNNVTINSIKIEGDQVTHRPMTATINWSRPANNELNENMFYVCYQGGKQAVGGISSFIAKGDTEELVIMFKIHDKGTHQLYLSSDQAGKYKICDIPGTFTFREIEQQNLKMTWDEKNLKQVDEKWVMGINEFHPSIAIENKGTNDYDDYIVANLIPVDSYGDATGDKLVVRKQVKVAAGARIDNENAIPMDFTGLTNGQRYDFRLYYYTNENKGDTYIKWATQDFFTVNTSTGIHSAEADSKADAPVYNMMGQRVGKNARGLVICKGKKYVR